jgi:HSP20 family protein
MTDRRITLVKPSQIFNSIMDEFFNSPSLGLGWNSDTQIDVSEDKNLIYVDIKAPGFKKEDLDISIDNDVLTITGNIKEEKEEKNKDKKYHVKEMRIESFTRTISLPAKANEEGSTAKVENGIIKIVIPKATQGKQKKITISGE